MESVGCRHIIEWTINDSDNKKSNTNDKDNNSIKITIVRIIFEQYCDVSFIALRLSGNSSRTNQKNRSIGQSAFLEVFQRYWYLETVENRREEGTSRLALLI